MNLNLDDFLESFKERKGFGVTGVKLDDITAYLNERIPEGNVRINVPYSNFNVSGKVSDVHHDVHGVMPYTYLSGHYDEVVQEEDTTTLFYGNARAGRGNYLPFLSECDVYFIKDCHYSGDELVVDLIEGPSWRMYL